MSATKAITFLEGQLKEVPDDRSMLRAWADAMKRNEQADEAIEKIGQMDLGSSVSAHLLKAELYRTLEADVPLVAELEAVLALDENYTEAKFEAARLQASIAEGLWTAASKERSSRKRRPLQADAKKRHTRAVELGVVLKDQKGWTSDDATWMATAYTRLRKRSLARAATKEAAKLKAAEEAAANKVETKERAADKKKALQDKGTKK